MKKKLILLGAVILSIYLYQQNLTDIELDKLEQKEAEEVWEKYTNIEKVEYVEPTVVIKPFEKGASMILYDKGNYYVSKSDDDPLFSPNSDDCYYFEHHNEDNEFVSKKTGEIFSHIRDVNFYTQTEKIGFNIKVNNIRVKGVQFKFENGNTINFKWKYIEGVSDGYFHPTKTQLKTFRSSNIKTVKISHKPFSVLSGRDAFSQFTIALNKKHNHFFKDVFDRKHFK